jgi:tetratricopeptide (TPR) repeat protein
MSGRILRVAWILLMTVGVVALAQTPTRRQQIAAIDKQLASGDVNEIHRGLAAIDAAIALDRFMAIEGLTHTWLKRLAAIGRHEEAADLAQRAMLAWPVNDYTILPLLSARIRALLALGRNQEALADARSAFNVANMERTEEAMGLVWQCLVAAYPNDHQMLLRFREEQWEGVVGRHGGTEEGSGFGVQGPGGSDGAARGNDEARNPKPESMAKDEARMTKTATEPRSDEATEPRSDEGAGEGSGFGVRGSGRGGSNEPLTHRAIEPVGATPQSPDGPMTQSPDPQSQIENQKSKIENIMSSIRIDTSVYDRALLDFGEDSEEGRCRENLLLMAGRTAEARQLIEPRYQAAGERGRAAAIEDMARLMKAEDGNIARARRFVESLRGEAGGK